MKKVAIVGVEGSGKTVMLAGLGELYSHPDENGYFLAPKNFGTAAYVAEKIERMRKGEWPTATATDAMQGLDWTLRRRQKENQKPEDLCEISFLDFPGEIYRAAFGVGTDDNVVANSPSVKSLMDYVREADDLIVLINLRDVITNGTTDQRVQEAMWITNEILSFALRPAPGRSPPHAAIAISQADSYAETIRACGGPKGVLARYLPHVANNYSWLDVMEVSAVDKTVTDADGNVIPAPDFKPTHLRPVIDWVRKMPDLGQGQTSSAKGGCGCMLVKTLLLAGLVAVGSWCFVPKVRVAVDMKVLDALDRAVEMIEGVSGEISGNEAELFYRRGRIEDPQNLSYAFKLFKASAQAGYAPAQSQLGWMYANGQGVMADDAEAVKWYLKAAERDDANAQNNLGTMYESGRGVPMDIDEAVRWYRKAAKHGLRDAVGNLKRLGIEDIK